MKSINTTTRTDRFITHEANNEFLFNLGLHYDRKRDVSNKIVMNKFISFYKNNLLKTIDNSIDKINWCHELGSDVGSIL